MTRSQIYKTIAEAFYCEPELRTEKQKHLTRHGICQAWNKIDGNNDICYYFICSYFEDMFWMFHFRERKYDLIRADFAWLMYLLTDKEYEVISK